MQDGFDLSVVVFILLAAFVGWRLYSVLGTRPGRDGAPPDRPRFKSPLSSATSDNTVVSFPDKTKEVDGHSNPVARDPDRWKGIAEADGPLANHLDELVAVDPSFDGKAFLGGAKSAYEAIVLAFAAGDRATLKDLLSRDVFESFVAAIAEREKRGETVETTFVSLDKAEITDVQLKGRVGQITLQFVSKLITATSDSGGAIIDGAKDKVVDVTDMWTFSRELGSRDPVWKLIATEAGH